MKSIWKSVGRNKNASEADFLAKEVSIPLRTLPASFMESVLDVLMPKRA